jgi:hypothetical protein
MRITVRNGWGIEKKSSVLLGEIEEFEENTRGTSGLAIGLGRSYGDSSLNSRGANWTLSSRNHDSLGTVGR